MQKKPLNLIFIVIIILFPKQSLAIESLAKTALIIDLSTNEVLLEKNSKAKTYPSSMTKMMTALVAFEKIKNLGLFYEENDEGVKVFAGPFLKSDINLKLDFLIKNGYLNAKKTP